MTVDSLTRLAPDGRLFSSAHDAVEQRLLLRTGTGRYVPGDGTNQAGPGFGKPDASWFRGESIDCVRDLPPRPNAATWEVLDGQRVGALIEDHPSGRENRRLVPWSRVSLEQWRASFLSEQHRPLRTRRPGPEELASAGAMMHAGCEVG